MCKAYTQKESVEGPKFKKQNIKILMVQMREREKTMLILGLKKNLNGWPPVAFYFCHMFQLEHI